MWQFFIFMELEQFSYNVVFTKTLNLSSERDEVAYVGQYQPRNNTRALCGNDNDPLNL